MPLKDYRGRPSKACETCRARRVKCDETKPSCQRCLKAGRGCRYRDLFEISFRDETEVAARKAQNAFRQRARRQVNHERSTTLPANQKQDAKDRQVGLALRPAPAYNHQDVVCARFIFDFSLPSDEAYSFKGILDFLPRLYELTTPDSALHAALTATSYINFFRRSDQFRPEDKVAASRHYNNALVRVQRDLQDETIARSDALLTAVYLMGIYETMLAHSAERFLETHAQGLTALLQLKLPPDPLMPLTHKVWTTAHMQLLSNCLAVGLRSPIQYEELREYYESSPYPVVRLIALMHQTVDALVDCSSHMSGEIGGPANCAFLRRLHSIDDGLSQWALMLPSGVDYEAADLLSDGLPKFLRRLSQFPGAPSKIRIYNNLQLSYSGNLNRALRLAIHCAILQCSAASTEGSEATSTWKQSSTAVRNLFDQICSSVYSNFILPIPGRADAEEMQNVTGLRGFLLLLPFRVALKCARTLPVSPVPEEQVQWAEEVVRFLLSINHIGRDGYSFSHRK